MEGNTGTREDKNKGKINIKSGIDRERDTEKD